jgi:hypothetical protein
MVLLLLKLNTTCMLDPSTRYLLRTDSTEYSPHVEDSSIQGRTIIGALVTERGPYPRLGSRDALPEASRGLVYLPNSPPNSTM